MAAYGPTRVCHARKSNAVIYWDYSTAAQLGFIIPCGFYGSLYTFAGNPMISDGDPTYHIQNGGADLGWDLDGLIANSI